ncbi:MAG: iron ABC transporter permease [Campylobacterota bacterium]|nr:iron ABC transporter permease [Campylobacterota bacterium]
MKNILIGLGILILLISPFFGQVDIGFGNIFDAKSMDFQIFWDLRIPRTLLAFGVGAILALAGLVFQTVFRNPMSTPFTLGVASGATLFTALGIVLGFYMYTSLFAFFGASLTVIILFIVASRFRTYETSSLLLVGIALSFFYSAALMVLFYVSDLQESYEIVRFTMGSLDIVGFDDVYVVGLAAVFIVILVQRYQYEIKLLLTSYEFAHLKGINVKKTNTVLLLSVSLVVGVCVSITGPIGFVGLIIPHIVKTITKQSAHKLILAIFFSGGVFLVLCDLIARNLGTVSDIPIGVVTSFVGAPFFIYLIVKRSKV